MKSFKKLRDFARQNHKSKEKSNNPGGGGGSDVQPTEDVELVTNGMKDVLGMQKRYEGLVTVSSQVSNRAYDLSTAVEEMASYFTTTYGKLDDKEIGKIFKLVGEVQFEISRSLELYATHVTQTVTSPTEILISDLQNVKETKKEYDEKRQSLDQQRMRTERERRRNGKGDAQDDEQLDFAKEDFDKVSRFLGCRLLSLHQGRSRSLITQAARHHAAQMQLFSKGLTSLHGIEPHMKQVTQELNINRRLSFADEDEFEDDEAVSNMDNIIDDYDMSYLDGADQDQDRRHAQDEDSGSESSENGANAQLEHQLSLEWSSLIEASGSDRHGTSANEGFDSPVHRHLRTMKGSKSAPTSPITVSEGVDNIQEVDRSPLRAAPAVPPPTRSPPVPSERDHSGTLHSDMLAHEYKPSTSERSPTFTSPRHRNNIPASSPRLHARTTKMGVPMTMFPPFEPSPKSWLMPLPPSADPPPALSFEAPSLSSTPRGFVTVNSITPKKKRYSYSGPLTSSGTPSGRPISSDVPSSGPLQPPPSTYKSGPPREPTYKSPKISPTISPPKMSPPRISELHKLPPPPLSASSSPLTAPAASLIAHSAPLPRPDPPMLNASPLPPPPLCDVTRRHPLSGATGKSQKQQWSKGTSITQLSEVEEEATSSSSQPKQGPRSGQIATPSTASKHQQTGSPSPILHRSSSGAGGRAGQRNEVLESRAAGKTQSGSVDRNMRRLNTLLHSSPSLTSAYSVISPPSVGAADARESAQPGNEFELGRRSLDAALPASNRNSKWSKWRSFSAHDRDDFPIRPQTGTHGRENSQKYGHSSSPRHVTTMNGIRHV